MKDFLSNTFANHPDYAVFCGVRVMLLGEGLFEVLSLLGEEERRRIPCALELSLKIEQVIAEARRTRETLSSEEKILLKPLFDYLDRASSEKRIGSLSEHLSSLFSRYGLYGEELLNLWDAEPEWQQWIWSKIYREEAGATYPLRALSFPVKRSLSQVHLFGFSDLPAVYAKFFERTGASFYLLSPCAMFWEDVTSDRERMGKRRYFEKKEVKLQDLEQWELYLRETNPLIANWGKVGRDFLQVLQNEEFEECYEEPNDGTVLSQLQSDLLLLRTPQPIEKSDESIQIHSAISPLREIEVLYDQLCRLIAQHRNGEDPIQPKEILVLAPDLDLYAPFIAAVFGASESALSYRLEGVSAQKELLDSVLHLLSLPEHKFSEEAVLDLFDAPLFREHRNLSGEDIAELRRWAAKANVRLNGWEKGIDRLLYGTVMELDEDTVVKMTSEQWPCRGVEASQWDLLGKLIELIRSLKEDLNPFSQHNMKGWLKWIDQIIQRYFATSEERESLLAEIRKLSFHFSESDSPALSLSALVRTLAALGENFSQTLHTHQVQGVVFRSLKQGHLTDAKVICLLGMNEESFPRKEPSSSLCALKKHRLDRSILKRSDDDRYLFLECVTLAQRYLVISYQRVDPRDNKESVPSLCVQELIHYCGDQIPVCHHPARPFDRRYFSQEGAKGLPFFTSFSQRHYQCARALYGAIQSEQPFFSYDQATDEMSQERIVDIRDLSNLAKHPIRFHFQEGLEMDLRSPEEEEGDFLLSALSRSFLRKKALKGSVHAQMKIWKEEGKLPLGVFGEAAIDALEEEITDLHKHLFHFGIQPEQIMSIELSSLCKEPLFHQPDRWILPPLGFPMPDGSHVHLVGLIDHFTPKGLLVHGDDRLEDWITCWPVALVLSCLENLPFSFAPQLLFTKSGKVKEVAFSDPRSLLARYIAYRDRALLQLSPLMPAWVAGFLEGTSEDLDKMIRQSMTHSSIEDSYLLWLNRRNALPDPVQAHLLWASYARELFHPLCDLKEDIDATV